MKNGSSVYLAVMMAVSFLISSLRADKMGADYKTYILVFEDIARNGSITREYGMEKGFLLFNLILGKFTDNYVFLGLSVNMIIFGLLYQYMKKNVDANYYVLIMYIFLSNPYLYIQSTFNILRQGCAMALILAGMEFLHEKKWTKCCLLIILAAQFHRSAYIIGVFLLVLCKIRWTRKKFLTIISSAAFFNIIIRNDQLLYKLASMFGYAGYIGVGKSEFNFLMFILFIVLVVLFFLLFYPKLYTDEKEKLYVDMYVLGLSLLPMFVLNDIGYRIYIIIVFISLPAVPIIWKAFKNMGAKRNYYAIVFGYTIYYVVFSAMFFYRVAGGSAYVPFRFFWQI